MVEMCPYGNPYCPCPDGDECHYEGTNPMPPPDVCGATYTLQSGKVDTCSKEPGHEGLTHRGRMAEWLHKLSRGGPLGDDEGGS